MIKSHKGFDIKWNIDRATSTGKSKALTNQTLGSMVWSPDGVWLTYSATGSINRYTASTPWDISTLGNFELGTGSGGEGIYVSGDGLKAFVADGATGSLIVIEYSLSIPHDVASNTFVANHSLASSTDETGSISFSIDGMQFFNIGHIKGGNVIAIENFTLSAPYDLTTAVSTGHTDLVAITTDFLTTTYGFIHPTGRKLYIGGKVNTGTGLPAGVAQYKFNTPWDITTLEFVSTIAFDIESQTRAVTFKPDGRAMYAFYDNKTYQYDIS